jgi:hypothetical protein
VAFGVDVTSELPEQAEAGATLKERTVGRGWQLFEPIDAAYERGEIDAGEWHRRMGAIIGPAYLAAANPRGQSGSSSTPAEREQARRFIFAAVNRDGRVMAALARAFSISVSVNPSSADTSCSRVCAFTSNRRPPALPRKASSPVAGPSASSPRADNRVSIWRRR